MAGYKKPTELDITKYGSMGYQILQDLNASEFEDMGDDYKQNILNARALRDNRDFTPGSEALPTPFESSLARTKVPYGQSQFDSNNLRLEDLEDLQTLRADSQPWYSQVVNGVAKGAIQAGTTFAQAMAIIPVGLNGLLEGIYGDFDEMRNDPHYFSKGLREAYSQNKTWDYLNKVWASTYDNDFTRALKSVMDWAEDYFPNYRTTEEQDENIPWWEKAWHHPANEIGDLFKNAGFTVGLVAAQAAYNAILPGSGGFVGSLIVDGLAATGEASIEALNAKMDYEDRYGKQIDEWEKENLKELDDKYRKIFLAIQEGEESMWDDLVLSEDPSESGKGIYISRRQHALQQQRQKYQEEKQQILDAGNATREELKTSSAKMGNMVYAMNEGILFGELRTAFGNTLGLNRAQSAIANKLFPKVSGTIGNYTARKPFGGRVLAVLKRPLIEGNEEMMQNLAVNVANDYYQYDVNNFYRAQFDPDAKQNSRNFFVSLATGIAEGLTDPDAWHEYAMGFIMGGMPVGTPRSPYTTNKNGTGQSGWQSPINWTWGPSFEWKEYTRKWNDNKALAEEANRRYNDPQWRARFDNDARNEFYKQMMNIALGGTKSEEESSDYEVSDSEVGTDKTPKPDVFNWETAKHASMVSDVLLWEKMGKLDDYLTMFDRAFETSDRNLEAIARNTTQTLEDGTTVGPFVDSKGNFLYDMPADKSGKTGKQRMIERLQESNQRIKKYADRIVQYRKDLLSLLGRPLADDQMDELVYLMSAIDNFNDRTEDIGNELKPVLQKIQDRIEQIRPDLGLAEMRLNAAMKQNNLPDIVRLLKTRIEGVSNASEHYKNLGKAIQELLKFNGSGLANAIVHYTNGDTKHAGIGDVLVRALQHEVDGLNESDFSKAEKEDIKQKLQDLLSLAGGRKIFTETFDRYVKNPQAQQDDHNRVINETRENEIRTKIDKLKQDLSDVDDVNAISDILSNETNDEAISRTLDELEKDPNTSQLIKDYREREQYRNDIIKAVQEADEDGQIKDDALKMLDWIMKNTQTVDRMASVLPTGVIDDWNAADLLRAMGASDEQISNNNLDAEYARYDEAKYLLGNIMNQINQKYKEAGIISQTIPQYVHQEGDAVAGTDQTNNESTSADPSGVVPAVNEGGTVTTKTTSNSGAIGDITSEQVAEDNESVESSTEGNNTNEASESYWKPAVPQMQEDKMRVREFEEFVATRGEGFRLIYEELKNRGAFDYINSGQLKPGDKVYFMISPDFESRKQNDNTYGGDKSTHTIFIVKKNADGTIQVLGDLNEGSSAERFLGLSDFRKAVIQQYTKAQLNPETKGKEFVTDDDLSTTIQKVMNGRIEYAKEGTSEKSLAQTPNIRGKNGDTQPKFGVMKNNTIQAKDIDAGQIEQLQDSVGKEGRLYLLVPNTRGGYSPVAVRVLHFDNTSLFNLPQEGGFYIDNDGNIDWSKIDNAFNTPVGRSLLHALVRMAQARDAEAIDAAFKPLKDYLYFGDVGVHFSPNGIVVKTGTDDSTTRVVDWYRKEKDENGNPVELPLIIVVRNLVQELQTHGVKLQIDYNKLNSTEVDGNGKTYNDNLIDSNLITSNLQAAEMVSGWFTMNIQLKGADGKFETVRAKSPVYSPTSRATTASTAHVDSVQGIAVKSKNTGVTYYVDLETGTIRTADGKKAKFNEEDTKTILALAKAYEVYGDKTEGFNMVHNHELLDDGTILDRNGQILMHPGEDEYDLWKQYIEEANKGNVNTDNKLAPGTEIMANPTGRYEKMTITEVRDDGYIAEFNGVKYFISEENAQKGKKMMGGSQQTQTQTQTQAQTQNQQSQTQTQAQAQIYKAEQYRRMHWTTKSGRTCDIRVGKVERTKDGIEITFERSVDGGTWEPTGQGPVLYANDINWEKSGFDLEEHERENYIKENRGNLRLRELIITNDGRIIGHCFDGGVVFLTRNPLINNEEYGAIDLGEVYEQFVKEKGFTGSEYTHRIYTSNGATAVVEQQQQQESESTASATSIIGGNLDIFNTEHVSKVSEENRDHSIETIDGNSKLGVYELDGKLYSGQLSPLTTVTIDGVSYPIHATKTRKDEEGECDVIVIMPNGYARKMGTYPDGLVGQRLNAIRKKIEEPSSNTRTLEQSTQKTQLFDPATQIVGVPMSTPVESGTNNTSNASATISNAAYGKTKSVKRKLPGQKKQQTEENPSQGESSDVQVSENPLENPPELNKEYDVGELERLFNELINLDTDAQNLGVLANKVFDVARSLGLKVKFVPFISNRTPGKRTVGRFVQGGTILIDLPYFLTQANSDSAHIILHETIHAVVNYALSDQMKASLDKSSNAHLREAVREIKRVYSILKNTELGREYGFTNVKEMIAELSNYKFREKLKKVGVRKSLWQRLKEAIIKIFTGKVKPHTNAYEMVSGLLDMALEHFDRGLYNEYNKVEDNPEAREMSDIVLNDISRDNLILKNVAYGDDVKTKLPQFKTVRDLEEFMLSATDEYVQRLKEDELVLPIEQARNEVRQRAVTNPQQLMEMMGAHEISIQDKLTNNKIDESKFTDDDINKLHAPLQEQLRKEKRDIIKEWIDAIGDYDTAIGYAIMRDLYKFVYSKGNNRKSPSAFVRQTFESMITRIEESTGNRMKDGKNPLFFNFYNEYNNEIWSSVLTDPAVRTVETATDDGIRGTWVRFAPASEITEGVEGVSVRDRVENMISGLKKVSSGTAWCTQVSGAKHVLVSDDHAFWALVPEGKKSAVLAVVPIKEGQEEQLKTNPWYTGIFKIDNGSANIVDPNMFENVNDLLRNSKDEDVVRTLDALGYNGMTREELEELKRQKMKAQIDYINNHEGLYTADDIEDLQNMVGITLTQTEDGLSLYEFNSGIYEQVAEEVRDKFWQDLFNSIKHVEDDLFMRDNVNIHSLGTIETVGGEVRTNEKLKSLGNLRQADSLVIHSEVESLGNVETVTSLKIAYNQHIKNLGNITSLAELIIVNSGIESLGNLERVQRLTLENCPNLKTISPSSSDKSLRVILNLDIHGVHRIESLDRVDYTNARISVGGNIKELGDTKRVKSLSIYLSSTLDNLGNIEEVAGDVFITNKVTSLRKLRTIGGTLNNNDSEGIELNPLLNFGELQYIGGSLDMNQFPNVHSLGKITHIGKDLISGKNLEDLGELASIGSNADLLEGKIRTLGKLHSVKGNLRIGIESLEDLGALNMVGGTLSVRYNAKNLRGMNKLDLIGKNFFYGSHALTEKLFTIKISKMIIGNEVYYGKKQIKHQNDIITRLINDTYNRNRGITDNNNETGHNETESLESSDYQVPMNTNVSSYEELDNETRTSLQEKGWTEERWNRAPQEVRDYAQQCVGF